MANGVRIQVTNRFPTQADVGETHFLSNAGNGNAYDVTQADVNCKVYCYLCLKHYLLVRLSH